MQKKLEEDFTATGSAAYPRHLGARRSSLGPAVWRDGFEHGAFKDEHGLSGHNSGSEDHYDSSGDAIGHSGSVRGRRDRSESCDRYKKLWIPGIIYHMKKLSPESSCAAAPCHVGAGNGAIIGGSSSLVEEMEGPYWMERESPKEVGVLERSTRLAGSVVSDRF